MYYHVYAEYINKEGKNNVLFWFDYERETLLKRIIKPFYTNETFFIGGIQLTKSNISRLLIFESEKKEEEIEIEGNTPLELFDTDRLKLLKLLCRKKIPEIRQSNILDEQENIPINPKKNIECNRIFIVHGTDHESVNELKFILQEVGVEPIILHEQPSRGLTIIEKLEEYSNVGYAFILLTPDDFSVKKEDILFSLRKYLRSDNPTLEQITQHLLHISSRGQGIRILSEILPAINNRARQNVILEFGYFIGRIGRRKVCCLYKGNVELPSDMHGICYLPFRNRVIEVKETILKELRAAEIIK